MFSAAYKGDSSDPSVALNLWSANSDQLDDTHPVVKTVYDPCPAGFHIPICRTFSGFTVDGKDQSDVSKMNIVGDFDNGYHFKTNDSTTPTIFFPYLPTRDFYGNLRTNDYSMFWTANRSYWNASYGGGIFAFLKTVVFPSGEADDNGSAYVRPASDNP